MPPLVHPSSPSRISGKDGFPAPKLEFSTHRLDLGDGKPNEVFRGEVSLTNRGWTPVKFSLLKHCGCTELSPVAGELVPGESETITVGLELPDHANSEKNTSIEAKGVPLSPRKRAGVRAPEAAEPSPILARCVVSARCPAPFLVAPAFISFGSLTAEEVTSASHEIRLASVAGQPPLVAEQLAVEHANDAFVVERAPLTRCASELGPRSATIRVSLKPTLRPGGYYDTVELRLAGSDDVMRVPLNAEIVEPISVVPATVSLRKDSNGGYRPVQLLVLCRGGREQLGKITLAEGPPGIQIDDLGAFSAGRRLRFAVSGNTAGLRDKTDVWLIGEGSDVRFGFKVDLKPSP